ncbi:MAG: M20/M25/M40 family metallo-hydrolase [Bryobacteraceae bacterium]
MNQRLLTLAFLACPLAAQVKLDDATYARIKSEELEHSQVMHTLHVLTDRYGPRLTGSPNFEDAANWVVKQMTEWGFKNAHLEPWDFGHPGWLNKRAEGYMVTPLHGDLTFRVLSWTPSTKGTVNAPAVEVEVPHGPPAPPAQDAGGRGGPAGPRFEQPTRGEFDAGIAEIRSQVKGKVVLVGKAAVVPVNFNPPPLRRGEGSGFGGRGGRGAPPVPDPNRMTAAQVTEAFDQFLVSAGALVRVNDAGMDHGLIRAFQNRTYDVAKAVPTVVLRNDDYGRIERLLADGGEVKLEFTIVNETYPKGKTSYDVVGEIPGTDKADEIVMLGGHLDSWHSATGATDNAIGSTMMLEAARLIQALGLKPRRTIRVGLWSGEEEGLLGSAAYVKQHFGTFEDQKAEYEKLDCYFNIDSGTGRVRGASIFGPPEAASIITAALEPFKDWAAGTANATVSRATGGTDSTNFNAAGLPGVGLQQDPIEYQSFTWHTQLDTYERIVPEDVKQAATEIASMVWTVANLDRMIPRLPKDQMPAPAGRGGR